MKTLLCMVLVISLFALAACKKAEEPAQGKQATNKQGENQKKPRRAKGAPRGLQIYQEEKLIVAIPREEYVKIMTTSVKVDGVDQKAVLLSDLLKMHNVTGKNVVLKGPNRATTITWEEVTTNPIYIYPIKNRLQIFQESKTPQDSKFPVVLVRIDVVEKPVASEAEKSAKKPAT